MKNRNVGELIAIHLGLFEPARTRYHLIARYWDKVSQRLKNDFTDMEERAMKSFQDAIRAGILQSEYALKRIPKDENWAGGQLVIPFPTAKDSKCKNS